MTEPGTIVLEEVKEGEEDLLDSDDEAEADSEPVVHKKKKKVLVDWLCVNPSCKVVTKDRLKTASSFTTDFYGIPSEQGKKRKVCSECDQEALDVQLEMKIKLLRGEMCLPNLLPAPKEIMTLDESDEDLVTDSSEESEVELELDDDDSNGAKLLQLVMQKLETPTQIDQCVSELAKRIDDKEEDFEKVDEMFEEIENGIDKMREDLYRGFRPQISSLPPLDLNTFQRQVGGPVTGRMPPISEDAQLALMEANLPPLGDLPRPELMHGEHAYAMRGNILGVWKLGSVTSIDRTDPVDTKYKLSFSVIVNGKPRNTQYKVLARKHIAYSQPAPVRLKVGTRVIAIYVDPDQTSAQRDLYAGIITEPPKRLNKYRYLIFFDDGYASYIKHEDIRVVMNQSPQVWQDVHLNSRDFVKNYLLQYPERPMVKMNIGQILRTEWNGRWWVTRVMEVDASLVRLHFQNCNRTESVYRGSTRLSPLYMELQKQKAKKENAQANPSQQQVVARRQLGRNAPYVEYTRQIDLEEPASSNVSAVGAGGVKRPVARKSTSSNKKPTEALPEVPKIKWESKGEIRKVDVGEIQEPMTFKVHECNPEYCLGEMEKYQFIESELKGNNPLLIPIMLGWKRIITRHKTQIRKIFYTAPCGRRLRNLSEIFQYLTAVRSNLEVDFFNFDWYVHVYNEFIPSKDLCSIADVSYGKEHVPVSCVNSLDNNYPEYVEYSGVRLPQKKVSIINDPEFLTCCDCTDGCLDKQKCACWQLTIQSTASSPDARINPNAGYVNRRLLDVVPTGIYECNSKCSCNRTCQNRVAQNPLRSKLQVFKTEKRGWGMRTLCDIPQGAFICIYVGNLYSTDEANEHGKNFGDEYFAELDMIETVERNKEGYESDIDDEFKEPNYRSEVESSDTIESTEDEEPMPKRAQLDKDDSDVVLYGVNPTTDAQDRQTRSKRKSTGKATYKDEDDEEEEEKTEETEKSTKPKLVSTRKFFGEDEDVYIMDAKSIGNIGRYLNHSCSPNVFVQNCFVDTHDLRFPWVSFFASTFIRAGSELCWDYCYIVNQVEGKEIYCECGADQCRGRLL